QRYGFMMRSGKAYLATPLNRFPVRRNPDAALIDQLDRNDFLEGFRRFARGKNATNATHALAHSLKDALFELAGDSGAGGATPPARVQTVIERLGGVVLYLARSARAREACSVLPPLTADWHMAADDGSAEFRIAAAIAGLGGSGPRMIHHLLPLESSEKSERWRCREDSPLHVWGQGGLDRNTAAVLQRRLLDSAAQHEDKPLAGRPPAGLAEVAALLQRATDDARIVRLMIGLALVRRPPAYLPRGGDENAPLPAAYALLKSLFTPDEQLRRIGRLRDGEHMPLPPTVPRLLNADRPEAALRQAQQRLRGSGHVTRLRHLSAAGLDGPRLLTALVVPLDDRALGRLLDRVLQAPRGDDEVNTA
ncbi:MAG TPA: type I-U CRISPR-associated protein Csx17, partial [Gammaproteobacteria bacterium]|nr:type I-U CRISPR-associated protein Csx17 [Gammaproteobacteria bacterium]